MAEHREQVDKQMMQRINRRVLMPLLIDLGARYLVSPYMGKYDDEAKSRRVGVSATNATATNATAPRSSTPALPIRTAKRRKARHTSASRNAIRRGR